jgi:hypothetical protein
MGNRLSRWKRNYLSYPGGEMVVKTVLSALATYFLTVFKIPKWAFSKMDKFRRVFLWKGSNPERSSGGHCLVNWQTWLRPKK